MSSRPVASDASLFPSPFHGLGQHLRPVPTPTVPCCSHSEQAWGSKSQDMPLQMTGGDRSLASLPSSLPGSYFQQCAMLLWSARQGYSLPGAKKKKNPQFYFNMYTVVFVDLSCGRLNPTKRQHLILVNMPRLHEIVVRAGSSSWPEDSHLCWTQSWHESGQWEHRQRERPSIIKGKLDMKQTVLFIFSRKVFLLSFSLERWFLWILLKLDT